MNTGKHLTLQDRQNTELMLNSKKSFSEIAEFIGKHKSTVSREVKAHIAYIRVGGQGVNYNNCKNRSKCQKKLDLFYLRISEKASSLSSLLYVQSSLPGLRKSHLSSSHKATVCLQWLWQTFCLFIREKGLSGQ